MSFNSHNPQHSTRLNLNTKGAIELSVNMLVVIILSLVIVGGGVALLYKFVGGASDIERDLDIQTQDQIDRLLLDEGRQTAMPIQTRIIGAGKSTILGLGIRNTRTQKETFRIRITFDRLLDPQGNMYESAEVDGEFGFNPQDWLLYNEEQFELEKGGYTKEGISISAPGNARSGEYVFKAKVTTGSSDEQYGRTQPFTIQIK